MDPRRAAGGRVVKAPFPSSAAALLGVSGGRRLAIALTAVGVVALIIGIVAGSSQGARGPRKSSGAATIQRRDIISTDTESGTLGYANPRTVYNRTSGTITWLPTVGQLIAPGQTLYRVDNNPVVLFNGSVPAYRDLSEGVSDGPDVQELKRNLVAFGFDRGHQITINQTFDSATTTAVEAWQAALGESQTGTVTLGQVVFLPGSQRITAVQAVLGSTGGSAGSAGSGSGSGSSASGSSGSGSSGSGSSGSGSSSGSSSAATTSVAPQPQFVSLTTTTPETSTTAETPTAPAPNPPQRGSGGGSSSAQLLALIALLKAEIAELRSGRSSSAPSGGGGGGGSTVTGRSASGGGISSAGGGAGAAGASGGAANAQPILQTTSTQEVVTVNLDATKQREAVVGEPVSVELPDGSVTDGRITQVSPVAQTSSGSSSGGAGGGASSTPSATIPVTIGLTGRRHVTGLDQAAVSVNFEQQTARNALSVPVSALLATAGGGYAVQEVAAPHRLLPVSPGLFGAGYVQISGPDIYEGLQVTDSQG